MRRGHNYRFQHVNKGESADLAKRLSVHRLKPSFPRLNIHQSHSAEDETASLFISGGGVPARSRYAHINDEDNSHRVIPNLLTRSLCRPFSQFDANPPPRGELDERCKKICNSLHQTAELFFNIIQ